MTREEAIKILSERHSSALFSERTALETLIPELKESEDERIRKAIMGLTYIDGIEPILMKCSITAQDIRKYLEKQKEKTVEWSEEDEEMRKKIVSAICYYRNDGCISEHEFAICRNWLEKQKDASKAIEAVDRIYKYIEVENVANTHDMNDSNPNKKYYCGWNDALGKIAGILQDVYFEKKKKESLRDFIDDFPYSAEKEERDYRKVYEDIAKSDLKKTYAGKSLGEEFEQKEQKPLEYLPKEKVYDIINKLTDLSYSKLIPFKSRESQKIDEISSDILGLLDYPIEKKQEQKPVDLEKEIEKKWNECDVIDEGMGDEYANIVIEQFDEICKYFYELGLNTRKED